MAQLPTNTDVQRVILDHFKKFNARPQTRLKAVGFTDDLYPRFTGDEVKACLSEMITNDLIVIDPGWWTITDLGFAEM